MKANKQDPLIRVYLDSKKYWLGLIVLFLMAMLAGILKSLSSVCWGKAVDFGVTRAMSQMIIWSSLAAGAILLEAVRTAFYYKLIGHTTEGMFLDFRLRTFQAINYADLQTIENQTRSGDIAMRVNSDLDNLSNFVAAQLPNILRLVFQSLFAVVTCFALSWRLALVYMAILPLSLFLIQKISEAVKKRAKSALDYTGKSTSCASEALNGILTVKAFGAEAAMEQKFREFEEQSYAQSVKNERVGMAMTGIKFFTSIFQLMVLFLFGTYLIQTQYLTVGGLIAFVGLTGYLTELLGSIDYYISSIRRGQALAQRVYEVLDLPPEVSGASLPEKTTGDCIRGKNLLFSYQSKPERRVLQELSFHVRQGQKVAVVGPSGCGKSTLLKLAARLYLPDEGELELFGLSSREWETDALRERIALVSQTSFLFDGSIYENVAYGKKGTSRDQVKRALEQVGLWSFIDSLPGKMDYSAGELGGRLSGGQRQRICIARAMVKGADLILLDEATSALDTQSEAEVQAALEKLMEGRSAVIVAHRMSTVQQVDYVYYMENGAVAEEGTPQELIAKKGRFYLACARQGILTEEGGAIQ